MKAYILNAFAINTKGGNGAGVVLEADNLSHDEMLSIANSIGLSETAFVSKSEKADFKVRFFTPTSEVDLCGHATVATFHILHKEGLLCGNYTQETKAGVLNIKVDKKGEVFMEQTLPKHYDVKDKQAILTSLNLCEEDLLPLPIEVVSTGVRDIIIPVKDINILKNIKPDFNKISQVSEVNNVLGYHVFTLDTNNAIASTRNFAPFCGIDEECATGTSNGALACYLYKHHMLENYENLVFEQGYFMSQPSEIKVTLEVLNNKITKVLVGGNSSNIKEIVI